MLEEEHGPAAEAAATVLRHGLSEHASAQGVVTRSVRAGRVLSRRRAPRRGEGES